jgi:hypothetical protein
MQPVGDLGGDRDAAARQPEDDRSIEPTHREPIGELAPRVLPVPEPRQRRHRPASPKRSPSAERSSYLTKLPP